MNKHYLSLRCLQWIFIALVGSSCFCMPANAYAGSGAGKKNSVRQTIKGTVTDAITGNPLSGATITVKGTSISATTNADGAFSITTPDSNPVLVISYIGFITQEITVTDNSPITISLRSASAELTQVVVVGYGTQNKKDITGSVKSLRSEAFNKGIINAPQELLQGKVAGVNVTSASGEPGGALQITVRGPGGVRTGSTPLFVVDGFPLDNSSTGGGDPLNFINPQDIESIDVLKDASATAIYGSRGANGVIIITTRRGRSGASTLSLSSSIGVSKLAGKLPVFSADQFRVEVPKLGGSLDDKGANTDWQDLSTRTALTQNYNLAMSGGANKLSYYASFGAQLQEGILKKNQMNRYSGRFNASQRFLDDKLIVDVNLGVANTKNERPPIGSILGSMITNNPTYPAYDANGNPAQYSNMTNPLALFELDKEIVTINRVIGNISPSLQIIKGLTLRINFGVDNSTATRDVVSKPSTSPPRDGRLETYNTYNRNTLIENYLTYATTFGSHNLSALAGYSYQKIFVQGRNTSINKFPINTIDPFYNPGIGQELTLANNRPGGYAFINELQSWFGRVTYQYKSKYLVTANFRADGSSKFGSNNKYGYFPSFSLGWRISEEDFMKNSVFSSLKLRAGWGLTGNQEIPPKITQVLYTSQVAGGSTYPLYASGPYPGGITYNRLANPDVQWEVSKQTNIGLDFGLLNGDLTGTIDVFHKISSNILLEVIPADPVQPATTYWTNVKDMEITNKGIELDLEYRKKITTAITLNVGGNVTIMDNKVEHSPYSVIPSGSASGAGLTSATINGYINGEPIGTFYLKQFTGFDNNGLSTFLDRDKDGIITDKDRVAAGTALPKVLYSFRFGGSYNGFDMSANFNGVSGNKIYDNTANSSFYKQLLSKNVNTIPDAIANPEEAVNNPAPVSSRYLKNGSYLRLNNLTLGYNFNTAKLSINKWIPSLRLSVTGQNLFVITDYNGFDPEVNTDRTINGVSSYGIDYLSYPKARSIIFNLNVSF